MRPTKSQWLQFNAFVLLALIAGILAIIYGSVVKNPILIGAGVVLAGVGVWVSIKAVVHQRKLQQNDQK